MHPLINLDEEKENFVMAVILKGAPVVEAINQRATEKIKDLNDK